MIARERDDIDIWAERQARALRNRGRSFADPAERSFEPRETKISRIETGDHVIYRIGHQLIQLR